MCLQSVKGLRKLSVYTKTLHFCDNRKCGRLYRFSIVSEWEQNCVVATSRLESCTIILFAVLIDKMLMMEYVKHYRRYTVLHILVF